MRRFRPRLLMLTAAAAALSVVTNGVGAVTTPAPPATRLGVAIQKDVSAVDAAATRRTRTLDLREQAARATEERLKAELADREATATRTGGEVPEAGEQFDSLARVYQAMKPARAAPIFEQLDMDVQMQVAKRMRDRSTAMILAAMSPRGAATLSMALARKSAAAPSRVPAMRSAAVIPAARAPAPAPPATPAVVAPTQGVAAK